MKILIDNGHGIDTPGKRSPDGEFREYRYNREIASALVAGLRERGFVASLLVPEDTDISLGTRVRRVNKVCDEVGANNVILISIHCNAAPPDDGQWHRARGWSAYTTKGETESDKLADCLYIAAEEIITQKKGLKIRKYGTDPGQKDWEEDFYILKNTRCPAVLTENFFMDNKEDIKYMTSTEGRKSIVQAHIEGIEMYLKK